MTSGWQRVREIWTVPRLSALALVVVAIFSFAFIAHEPSTGPLYSPAKDKSSVLTVAGNVYNGVEAENRTNGLPIPVARTAADMRKEYGTPDDHGVRVLAHGANIEVTFPKEPPVCVWVPVIVDGPKEPALVSC
jgi:hypothetical protein